MTLRYAVHAPSFAEPDALVELAIQAERCGWDGYLLWDHILGSTAMLMPIADSWVVLGAIARATSRIRIGTAVTPVARRRPWKLAREVTTLNRLSGGRAILGVGLGNPLDAEYGAFGEPTDPGRIADRLDEGLRVLDGLQSGESLHFAGRYFQVDDATFLPRPVQLPRVPVWVACTGPRGRPIHRAAQWDGAIVLKTDGDAVVPPEPGEIGEMAAAVRRDRADTDRFDLAVVLPGLPADPAAYEAAGATWALITGYLDDLPATVAAGPPASLEVLERNS